MNIFYFVERWPKESHSAQADKILSMTETLINMNKHIFLVSADQSDEPTFEELKKLPIEMVHVNKNKIWASLTGATSKPDLALFNCPQMERMYSLFLYSKWNKCPRVLELNRMEGLKSWRKRTYGLGNKSFIHDYDCDMAPDDPKQRFSAQEDGSIVRSDFVFCGNDWISHNFRAAYRNKGFVINSMGVPLRQYNREVMDLAFRAYRHRKHFAYLGNFSDPENIETVNMLTDRVWPLIKKQLKDAELHLYGSGYHKELTARKKELEKKGIKLIGYTEDTNEIERYRAVLFPTQVGGGIKGAMVESWFQHTPIVTTPAGAQGLFLETSEPMYSTETDGKIFNGFFKERELTVEEEKSKKKVASYYKANKYTSDIQNFPFGGLCDSFSIEEFAQNAVKLYTDEALWNKCLLNLRASLRRNQCQKQLQVNLSYGISQIELATFENRQKKEYKQEWSWYLNSSQAKQLNRQRYVK